MKLAVMITFLLLSCAKHVPLGQPVSGQDYAYERVGEAYHLFARNAQAYKQAMQEICGGHVCQVERSGEIFVITVTP